MIREFHLADVFTLANGFLGAAALLSYMRFLIDRNAAYFWLGTALLPFALAMDVLDGRIARRRRRPSALGQELDSLADVVSFGVAPAALAFAAGMRGGWDAGRLFFFVCCGVSRLARYNVTARSLSRPATAGKVRYFEGAPIPTSVLLTGLLAMALARPRAPLWGGEVALGPWMLHLLALMYMLSGSLMISKTLHIPKP